MRRLQRNSVQLAGLHFQILLVLSVWRLNIYQTHQQVVAQMPHVDRSAVRKAIIELSGHKLIEPVIDSERLYGITNKGKLYIEDELKRLRGALKLAENLLFLSQKRNEYK